ncbi:hypothetical protein DAI22_03g265675 [Oryza sativa Japonica Group]|nr:hypothetical protein DAI22_03g265675 [Oryza sativa Japonica Group]
MWAVPLEEEDEEEEEAETSSSSAAAAAEEEEEEEDGEGAEAKQTREKSLTGRAEKARKLTDSENVTNRLSLGECN